VNPDPSRSNDPAEALLAELTRLLLAAGPAEGVEPRPEIGSDHLEIDTAHEPRVEILAERFTASDYRGALDLFPPERRAEAALLLIDTLTEDELAGLVSENGLRAPR